MHHSMSTLVFTIPHLFQEVVSSLTPYDLTVCARVSSHWNTLFEAFIWHTLHFTDHRTISRFSTPTSSSPGAQTGLHRNQHNIRTLKIDLGYTLESGGVLPKSHTYPNLTHLEFKSLEKWSKPAAEKNTILARMIRFLKRNTSLQTVRLDGFPLDDDSTCKLLSDALETHPWLSDLEINGGDSAKPSSVAYILQGVVRSPRVSALKMVSVYHGTRIRCPGPSSLPQDLLPVSSLFSSTHDPSSTRLKHLCFDPNVHEPEYNILLLALLRHSPHLERLSFILPTSNQHLKHFISALSEFPKLQHLELVDYSTTTDTDTDYPADLILASSSASAHLQSFTLRSSQTRPTLPPPFGARGVQALAHHQHSRTLERLDFRNYGKVESKDLQLLLTSCPHLTEFMAIDVEAPSREQNRPRIHVTDLAASGAWVCGGLRELHIGFTGFATLTPTSNESGSAAVKYYTNLIYTRLASLPALKTLCLAGGELLSPSPSLTTDQWIAYFDLSLKTGLSKLATLKKLETLNLSQMTHLRIGKAEAAWMVENWRWLCSVTLPVQDPVTMEEEYRATAARHFMDLICVRPTLTVSIFV